jgi:hypothetical protein
MAPHDPEVRRARARLAAVTRHHPDQADLDADARRDLKAANAAQYVRALVADWPPLSDAQRGRLAALLAGSDPEGGGDDGAPDTDRGRRLGQTDGPHNTPRDNEGRASVADRWDVDEDRDAARHAGELLQAWVGCQMDAVDELVAEAKVKLSTLPSQQVLWELFGEWLIRLTALERDVAELRADVARLRRTRGRAA